MLSWLFLLFYRRCLYSSIVLVNSSCRDPYVIASSIEFLTSSSRGISLMTSSSSDSDMLSPSSIRFRSCNKKEKFFQHFCSRKQFCIFVSLHLIRLTRTSVISTLFVDFYNGGYEKIYFEAYTNDQYIDTKIILHNYILY